MTSSSRHHHNRTKSCIVLGLDLGRYIFLRYISEILNVSIKEKSFPALFLCSATFGLQILSSRPSPSYFLLPYHMPPSLLVLDRPDISAREAVPFPQRCQSCLCPRDPGETWPLWTCPGFAGQLQYGQHRGREPVTAEMLLPLGRGLSCTSSGPVEFNGAHHCWV